MKPSTERLIQLVALALILYFGWSFAKEAVLYNLQLQYENRNLKSQVEELKQSARTPQVPVSQPTAAPASHPTPAG